VRLAAVDEGSGLHNLSSDDDEGELAGVPAVVTMMPPMTLDPVADGLLSDEDNRDNPVLVAQYTTEAPAVCLLHANVELPAEEAVHLADKGKPPLMLEHGQDKHACFKVSHSSCRCCTLLLSGVCFHGQGLFSRIPCGGRCFDRRCCSQCCVMGPWQQRLTCAIRCSSGPT
jgi:hypothetical protein